MAYRDRIEHVDEHPSADPVARPRRARRGRALRYAAVTGTIGALAVVAAAQTGGVQWSLRAASWVLFGFCFGAVFGPLFAMARENGGDEVARRDGVPVHGNSDTSFEGAQARDLRRRDEPGQLDG